MHRPPESPGCRVLPRASPFPPTCPREDPGRRAGSSRAQKESSGRKVNRITTYVSMRNETVFSLQVYEKVFFILFLGGSKISLNQEQRESQKSRQENFPTLKSEKPEISNENPLYRTGNSTQCPVMTDMEKASRKAWIYV